MRLDILFLGDEGLKTEIRQTAMHIVRLADETSGQIELLIPDVIDVPKDKTESVRKAIEDLLVRREKYNELNVRLHMNRLVVYNREDDEPDPGDEYWKRW